MTVIRTAVLPPEPWWDDLHRRLVFSGAGRASPAPHAGRLTSWCVIAVEACLPDQGRGYALAVRSETRPAMAR